MAGMIADDNAPESLVSDEDVGAEAEYEPGNAKLPRREHGGCEILGSSRRIEEIRRTTNAERGVWRQELPAAQL